MIRDGCNLLAMRLEATTHAEGRRGRKQTESLVCDLAPVYSGLMRSKCTECFRPTFRIDERQHAHRHTQ